MKKSTQNSTDHEISNKKPFSTIQKMIIINNFLDSIDNNTENGEKLDYIKEILIKEKEKLKEADEQYKVTDAIPEEDEEPFIIGTKEEIKEWFWETVPDGYEISKLK